MLQRKYKQTKENDYIVLRFWESIVLKRIDKVINTLKKVINEKSSLHWSS